jgi:hypothetical protein
MYLWESQSDWRRSEPFLLQLNDDDSGPADLFLSQSGPIFSFFIGLTCFESLSAFASWPFVDRSSLDRNCPPRPPPIPSLEALPSSPLRSPPAAFLPRVALAAHPVRQSPARLASDAHAQGRPRPSTPRRPRRPHHPIHPTNHPGAAFFPSRRVSNPFLRSQGQGRRGGGPPPPPRPVASGTASGTRLRTAAAQVAWSPSRKSRAPDGNGWSLPIPMGWWGSCLDRPYYRAQPPAAQPPATPSPGCRPGPARAAM